MLHESIYQFMHTLGSLIIKAHRSMTDEFLVLG